MNDKRRRTSTRRERRSGAAPQGAQERPDYRPRGFPGLVFSHEYVPDVPFRVVSELDWTLTEKLLSSRETGDDGGRFLLPEAGDHTTYVVDYERSSAPDYAFFFTQLEFDLQHYGRYRLLPGEATLLDYRGYLVRVRFAPG